MRATACTKRMTQTVLEKSRELGNTYPRPDERVAQINNMLRKQKEDEKLLREKILSEKVDMAASNERKAALVFRILEDKKRQDNQLAKVKLNQHK